MARFRVRDNTNTVWLDVCYSDFFVRNNTNSGWIRIQPNGFMAVRNGDNTQWLAVACVDSSTDRCAGLGDPYDPDNPLGDNNGHCIESEI